jgi:hypothetical protein
MFEFPLDRIVVPCETILYGTVPYCIVPYGLFHVTGIHTKGASINTKGASINTKGTSINTP